MKRPLATLLALCTAWASALPAAAQLRPLAAPAPLEAPAALALPAPLPPLAPAPLSPLAGEGRDGGPDALDAALPPALAQASQAPQAGASDESSGARLSSLFEGSGRSAAAAPVRLEAAREAPAKRAPRRRTLAVKISIGTALKLGASAAAAAAAVDAAPLIAQALGYASHSNYNPPAPSAPLLLGPLLRDLARQILLYPMVEEAVFRAGLMGGLRSLLKKSQRLDPFWVSALVSSAVFAGLHESADPLLFASRLAGSLAFSWAYEKGGWSASTTAHGLLNAAYAAAVLACGAWSLNQTAGFAVVSGAAWAALALRALLKKPRAGRPRKTS